MNWTELSDRVATWIAQDPDPESKAELQGLLDAGESSAAELSERYDVARAQAQADVARIVDELRMLDLVSPGASGRA